MSEKDLLYVNHYQTLRRKELSESEESEFNKFTNQYIERLATIDPVLAGIMKNTISDAFGSNDYQTFEGTLEELNNYISKVLPKEPIKTGFCVLKPVSARLAHWLNIDSNSMLTGPRVTQLVWEKLKEKNLVYESDKRVFRADHESTELFGLNIEVVNASTSHRDLEGFNFCNLQRYIAHANQL